MKRQAYKAIKKDSPIYYQQLLKDTGFTDEELFKELQTEKEAIRERMYFVTSLFLLIIIGIVSAYGVIVSL